MKIYSRILAVILFLMGIGSFVLFVIDPPTSYASVEPYVLILVGAMLLYASVLMWQERDLKF